jgi:hypothetical protein
MTKIQSVLMSIALIAVMACVPVGTSAAPELPGGPVAVSEAAADELDQKIAAAYQEAYADPEGKFTLRASDEEVTSWMVYRVATMPENNIKDPQIRFLDGKIHSAMTMVNVLPFELRVKMVALFQVIAGKTQFEIESSSAGFLPLPKEITALLPQSDMVNDILVEAGVELNSIEIVDGEIVMSGRLIEPAPETAG